MKCQNCGANVENAQVCPNCGTILQAGNSTPQQTPTIIINNVNKNENTNTNAGYGGNGISHKSKMVALILAIFLGYLGIHRFYVGKVGSGIIWFLTGGLFMCGWIYDIAKIASGTFTDGAGCVIRK